jgi:hypothetical protein
MYLVHDNASFALGGSSTMDEQELSLRNKLETLRERHRNLDEAISKISQNQQVDQLQLRRLKKDKLMLRDQISMLEDMLYPDIIA